jgi:DNA polymerase I
MLWVSGDYISVDIETYRRRFISCVGFAHAATEAMCIPFFSFDPAGKCQPYWSLEQELEIWNLIRQVLHSPRSKIVGQNFLYDTQFFKRWLDIDAIVSFDTMVAHHLLYPGTPKGLDDLASLYCEHYLFWKKESQDWDTKEFGAEAHWLYNARDCLFTYEIAMALLALLKSEKMEELYAFQLEQWKLAREMSLRGIRFDTGYINQIQAALTKDEAAQAAWLEAAGPADLADRKTPWYNSPVVMQDLFYNRLGLPKKAHKKTGKPTMDDSALLAIEESQPWLAPMMQRIQHLRSVQVFRRNWKAARVSADGRLHCSFNPAHVETFRWSSSATGFEEGTNLQNVPKPTED